MSDIANNGVEFDHDSGAEPGVGYGQPWPPVDVSPAGLHVVGTRPFVGGVIKRLMPDVRLIDCQVTSMEVGTTTRVRLSVQHDGPRTLPRAWFVKMPSLDWRARMIGAVPRLLRSEARWYRQLAGKLPVETPVCLATGSAWRGACVILADLAEHGATTLAPGDALDVDQVGKVIDTLALLHASFHESALLDGPMAWMGERRWRREARFGRWMTGPILRAGLRAAATLDLPAALPDALARYGARRHRLLPNLRRGPRTLLHHDCHPGNLYFDDGRAGLLDWQMARIGDGAGDVAYLLATALEPDVRRTHEEALLARYADGLARHGAHGATGNLFERYRCHLAYPMEAALATLGIGGLMNEAAALDYVRRSTAAATDHDALARLTSLAR